LACDVLIASENARFADTHARVGIMPGWGLSQKLSRLVGPYRARELSLSGNFLDAATAERWGLVNRVVAADALLGTAVALARDMADIAPGFSRAYKALINDGYALDFGAAMALEATRSTAANAAVSANDVEAARAAVQERGRKQ
jgi:enoyl-CoA hydratase